MVAPDLTFLDPIFEVLKDYLKSVSLLQRFLQAFIFMSSKGWNLMNFLYGFFLSQITAWTPTVVKIKL